MKGGDTVADWRLKGQYIKNCNCAATCSCDTTGFPSPHPQCEGVLGMVVTEGHFEGTDLSGARFAVIYHWPGALHEGNGSLLPIIDESTSEAQRTGLLTILSGQAGGPLFEIVASIVTTVHDPVFAPVSISYDRENRTASLSVPGYVETETVPLTVPATGDLQRAILRLPDGFEYKEMDIGLTRTMRTTGPIAMDYHDTHSSLAVVVHTPAGVA
jgi:hypothetical protein